MHDLNPLDLLRNRFLERCFEIVEEGVEKGNFRMKDVAGALGISSQVASKLVNPTSPRTLTAFELFRLSVLARRPVSDLIPLELYLMPDELNDTDLCRVLRDGSGNNPEESLFIGSYMKLPERCRKCVAMIIQAMMKDMK